MAERDFIPLNMASCPDLGAKDQKEEETGFGGKSVVFGLGGGEGVSGGLGRAWRCGSVKVETTGR